MAQALEEAASAVEVPVATVDSFSSRGSSPGLNANVMLNRNAIPWSPECNVGEQIQQFEATRTEYQDIHRSIRYKISPLTKQGWAGVWAKVSKLRQKELFSDWFQPCNGFDLDELHTLRHEIDTFRKYCMQQVAP